MTPSTVNAPKSGFRTPQFWISLLAIIATFILSTIGVTLPSSDTFNNLPDWLKNNIVPGVILVGIVVLVIAVWSWIETRTVRIKGIADKGVQLKKHGKYFWQTSEFWLGFITVVLNYLQDALKDNPNFKFAQGVHASTDTTTLLLALVYMFARAQLKQAYVAAQTADNTEKK
jgi:hypothetical protein